jgi:CubicO group peptidase (beta-lactamase class C family)
MKKLIISLVIVLLVQESRLNAQITSPTFDPVFAAKLQEAINAALPTSGVHGVSVAITFPGMGTFIGVAGESAPGIPMTPDMQFGIGSNTKTFTAVLALKLQELGILSLDDPISKYFPAHRYIDGSATIRQCLSHQSGIFDYDHADWIPDTITSQEQLFATLQPAYFPVGKGYQYSNTNYNIVALAMEAATGKTYTQLLHQYIFDPLHLDSTFLAQYESPNGNVAHGWFHGEDAGNPPLNWYRVYWAAGGIFSTANEMVQWYDNLFAGNVINQPSLVQLRTFDNSTFYALGLEYKYAPFLKIDDVVNGHGGEVPGYSSQAGFDFKRQSSLCILTNQGGDKLDGITNIVVPVVRTLYLDYTRRLNDAGITTINSPLSEKCNGTFSPEVLLQNYGTSNLQSVTINYQVDNGTINSYFWTGNLVRDATANVTLPSMTSSGGYHSFRAFTSNPNGDAEGYDYNNEASSKFTINNGPFATSIDEGFEGPVFPQGWQNGNNTVFDWGVTNVGYFANGSNKSVVKNCWDDIRQAYYDLELPYLDLNADKNPVLSFNYEYAFNKDCNTCIDELTVLVSKDCGKTYHSVFNKKGQALKTVNANTYYYPQPNDWGTRTVNLSAYKTNVLIKFRITNGNGNLIYLDNIKIADVSALCQSPTDLDESQMTASSVKLIWKFRGGADHFDVYYRPKNTVSWIHKTEAGNKLWTNISGLLSSTDYEWYITAACSSGNSLASARSYFTTDSEQTGITSSLPGSPEVADLQNQLKIFPNPSMNNATISFSLSKQQKISLIVYEITGRLVKKIADKEYNEGTHQVNMNTKDISPGIYLLRMQSAEILQTRKFIVQH